jgi:thiol:disulfide interchange protein
MKPTLLPTSLLLSCLLALFGWTQPVHADDTTKTARPKVYDESADGSKQIADALAIAKKENKRVLLQFGANWCFWCKRLHKMFETDQAIAEQLKNGYVLVLIDVNGEHNQTVDLKYGHPTKFGIPAIVVLDADGKRLTTNGAGGPHTAKRAIAFLKQWAPPQPQTNPDKTDES